MNQNPENAITWLGPTEDVRGRVRVEMQRTLLVDRENGFVELPRSNEWVNNMTQDLLDIHESIRPLFLKWWEHEIIDDETSIHGFTVASLHRTLKLRTVMSTFTWLDGLVRDPEDAKRKIAEKSKGLNVWRIGGDRLN